MATDAALASCASHSADSMSSGKPSTTGPGRPEHATWNARLTYSGMRSVCRITAAHFTKEENRRLTSISWNASRSSCSRAGMPTNSTMGEESCWATCSPLMALAAPGPRVTKHTPGALVNLPQASAIIEAPPSWRQMTVLMRFESCSPSSAARKLSPGTVKAVVAPCASSWSIRILPPCRMLISITIGPRFPDLVSARTAAPSALAAATHRSRRPRSPQMSRASRARAWTLR